MVRSLPVAHDDTWKARSDVRRVLVAQVRQGLGKAGGGIVEIGDGRCAGRLHLDVHFRCVGVLDLQVPPEVGLDVDYRCLPKGAELPHEGLPVVVVGAHRRGILELLEHVFAARVRR